MKLEEERQWFWAGAFDYCLTLEPWISIFAGLGILNQGYEKAKRCFLTDQLMQIINHYVTCFLVHKGNGWKTACIWHINQYKQIPWTISKTGRWHWGYPGFFFRLFPDYTTSGHEARDFPETISRSILWVLLKNLCSQNWVMTQTLFWKLFPLSVKSFRNFFSVITRIFWSSSLF